MLRVLIIFCSIFYVSAQEEFKPAKSYSGKGGGVFIRSISSENSNQKYEYSIDENVFNIDEESGAFKLSLGSSANIENIGEPSLPFISQRTTVPQTFWMDSVSFSAIDSVVFHLKADIDFAKEQQIPGFPVKNTIRSEKIYKSSEEYPTSKTDLVTVQKMAGIDVAFVNITPFSYFPAKKRLVLYTNFIVEAHLSSKRVTRNSISTTMYPERVDFEHLGVENSEDLPKLSRNRVQGSAQYLVITNKKMVEAVVP